MHSAKEVQLLQSVINKAWNDPAFKEELIGSPVEAIQKVAGVAVSSPEGRELVVLDQTDTNYLYLNIPPRPESQSANAPIICFPTDEI